MSNLEPLRKIIEEIKNMTLEQEEQFKKDIEKLTEKYKPEDYNYDDIDIILPNEDEVIAELIDERDKIDDETRYMLKDIIDSAKDIAGADIEMDMIDDYLIEKYEEQDKHITSTDIKKDVDIKKGDK